MWGDVLPVGEFAGANRGRNWKLALCGALWFEQPFWVEVPALVTESRLEAYRDQAEALATVRRFPQGSRVIAHANPRDPARAVLDWGNRREAAEPALGGALVALAGLSLGVVGWWGSGR